jgi:hypothetical protein
MTKENGIVLTKEAIANEGIEIKLTQSDVIDALVEEQLASITSIAETLKQTTKDLTLAVKDEFNAFLDKLVEKTPLPKGLVLDSRKSAYDGYETQYIYGINEYNDKHVIRYDKREKTSFTVNAKGTLFITYTGEFSGIKVTGTSEGISFKFNHSKKLLDMIQKHNEKVIEFIQMVPANGLNEKEIAKKIKNHFTKEILRSSSAEFRAKLKEGFGLNL